MAVDNSTAELLPETWVDEHGDALFGYALSRLKNSASAEDVVQETFLAALGARKNYKGRSTTRTWLIAILKHKIVDYIRKKVREQDTDKLESMTDGIDVNFTDRGDWQHQRLYGKLGGLYRID